MRKNTDWPAFPTVKKETDSGNASSLIYTEQQKDDAYDQGYADAMRAIRSFIKAEKLRHLCTDLALSVLSGNCDTQLAYRALEQIEIMEAAQ